MMSKHPNDSDHDPAGDVDPDEMKNPDRSEEGQRRREHTSGDSDPDGREVAEMLYGGDSDRESQDFNEGDRVAYLADHEHEYRGGSTVGTVTEVRPNGVMVDYSDGSPSAKLTPRRNLHKLDSDE